MEVADKAISTEDFGDPIPGITRYEVARLEAVFTTLLENKVEAMKNEPVAAPGAAGTASAKNASCHSSPKRPRITSSSTMSSSHKDTHHHHSHHHNNHRHPNRHHGRRKYGEGDGDYSGEERKHRHRKGHHSRHRTSRSLSPESPRYRRAEGGGVGSVKCCETANALTDEDVEALGFLQYEAAAACSSTRSERCCCYTTMKNGQIKLQCEVDYISLNMEDFEEEAAKEAIRRARRKRRRRKRRKKHLHNQKFAVQVQPIVEQVKLIDPDDLPQRARWTIVITACLLLLMSLLLVGATLRMAPIIDDMVRKENEELMNSLHREAADFTNTTSELESS